MRITNRFLLEVFSLKPEILTLYHSSYSRFTKPRNLPMWFSLNYDEAVNGWYANIKFDSSKANLYSATFNGSIARYYDPFVIKLFKDNNYDINDYIVNLSENPTQKEILEMNETKLLMSIGYNAFINNDYDPRDFAKDLDSIVVFKPSVSIKTFKRITVSGEK